MALMPSAMEEKETMPVINVGTRVGAFESLDENGLRMIGYGVYEGDFLPPFLATEDNSFEGFSAWMHVEHPECKEWPEEEMRNAHEMYTRFRVNPRIQLDNGDVVWGFEVYWIPEEAMKKIEAKAALIRHVRPERDEKGNLTAFVLVEPAPVPATADAA